jgi:hypothetical protein
VTAAVATVMVAGSVTVAGAVTVATVAVTAVTAVTAAAHRPYWIQTERYWYSKSRNCWHRV